MARAPSDPPDPSDRHDWQVRELAERREIKRYVLRLFAVIVLGALSMVALGLYLYRSLDAGRGETTRRVPVVKQVDADGTVRYLPARPAPQPSATPHAPASADAP